MLDRVGLDRKDSLGNTVGLQELDRKDLLDGTVGLQELDRRDSLGNIPLVHRQPELQLEGVGTMFFLSTIVALGFSRDVWHRFDKGWSSFFDFHCPTFCCNSNNEHFFERPVEVLSCLQNNAHNTVDW